MIAVSFICTSIYENLALSALSVSYIDAFRRDEEILFHFWKYSSVLSKV